MKLKTILILLLVTMCCFMLGACDESTEDRITPIENDTMRFQYIGSDKINHNGSGEAADVVQYYLDNETNVVYAVILNRAGNGTWAGFTPIVETDGTYVTYQEFIKDRK